jgi:hypothetical protein
MVREARIIEYLPLIAFKEIDRQSCSEEKDNYEIN